MTKFENLLLQNHSAYFNQTCHKASLGYWDFNFIQMKGHASQMSDVAYGPLVFFFNICDLLFKIVKTDSTTADARRYVASVWTMILAIKLRENEETDVKLILSLLCVKVRLIDPADSILCFNKVFFQSILKTHFINSFYTHFQNKTLVMFIFHYMA